MQTWRKLTALDQILYLQALWEILSEVSLEGFPALVCLSILKDRDVNYGKGGGPGQSLGFMGQRARDVLARICNANSSLQCVQLESQKCLMVI